MYERQIQCLKVELPRMSFQQIETGTLDIYIKTIKHECLPYFIIKAILKWVSGLSVKCKTIGHLEENIIEGPPDIIFDNDFLKDLFN